VRITLLVEAFTPGLGYIESGLSKALARLGAEVSIVTMDLLSCYRGANQENFGCATGLQALPAGSIHHLDGYAVHVLAHKRQMGQMRMVGLFNKVRALRPDILQTFTVSGWPALDACTARLRLGCRLFTGSHRCACTFPDPAPASNLLLRQTPGRLTSLVTEKCYAATADCARVAVRFMGVQHRKIVVQHLGFDAESCHPVNSPESHSARTALRRQLGFDDRDIVAINTGKLNVLRNALFLAESIASLRRDGQPLRGLFIGCGSQSEAIAACDGCTVLPLMPAKELPAYYRAADIAWWPQATISIVDSAACGLPLLAGTAIDDRWFLNGNGLVYRHDDAADLQRKLLELSTSGRRESMGALSASLMHAGQSWEALAKSRLRDYEVSLGYRRWYGI
jgi:glycosyltransferase involved in cell wall biosynthesis